MEVAGSYNIGVIFILVAIGSILVYFARCSRFNACFLWFIHLDLAPGN